MSAGPGPQGPVDLLEASGLVAGHHPMPEAEAVALLSTVYGRQGSVERYTTEKDDTFGVETTEGRLVLKVSHPDEPLADITMQLGLMDHMADRDPGLPVPEVIRTLGGTTYAEVVDAAGQARVVRLMTFQPGTPAYRTTMDAAERAKVGRTLGRMRLASEGFEHPHQYRVLPWDVQHVQALRPLLEHQRDPAHHRLLELSLDRLAGLSARIDALPRQVLHNDFNRPNMMVDHDAPDFVTGVIDFGDCVHTAVAIDVATSLVDFLPAQPGGYAGEGTFADAADVLGGYLQVAPLTAEELALVPHLMMARAVAIGLITTPRAELFPDNAEYILRTTEQVWHQLEWYLGRSIDDVSGALAPTGPSASADRSGV